MESIWHSHEVRFHVQLPMRFGWLMLPPEMCMAMAEGDGIPQETIDQYIRDKIKAMVAEQVVIEYEVLK